MASKYLAPALAASAALLGLAAASFWYGAAETPGVQLATGTLLPQPRQVSDFSLTGDDGQPYTRQQLAGGWTVLFPGFVHCPDVCPTTLAMLKQLEAKLAAQGAPLRVVFLSVDPARDTPEQMRGYVQYFNPAFRAVTAPEPQLGAFTRELGIAYAKVPGESADSYSMDHTAALVLLNPQAQVAGYFSPPFNVDALAADLAKVIKS